MKKAMKAKKSMKTRLAARGKSKGMRARPSSNGKSNGKSSKMHARRPAARSSAQKKTPEMTQEQMMKMWQKTMTPGPGHERLEPMVGSWHAKTTFVMSPGAPSQVSEGVSENRWVLGGRYLEQSYKSPMMGMPFEGLGYTAFDNVRGRYVGSWMDTFGTGLMSSIGVGKPNERNIDFEAESYEPSGKQVKFLCKIRIQDRDHHTYEMWTKGPNGKNYRTMLIEYTRT